MATIRQIIDIANGFRTNTYTDAQKLIWLNEVEQCIKEEIIKTYLNTTIQRVISTAEYSLPTSVMFEDIEIVYLNRERLNKLDKRSYLNTVNGALGYYKPTTTNKIAICPTPTATDNVSYPSIQVSYLDRFVDYTNANSYGTSMLITQARYYKIYTFYIMAQIDFYNKEYENYNNTIAQYNATLEDYKKWYNSRRADDIPEVLQDDYPTDYASY
jgi:hypothetical protein